MTQPWKTTRLSEVCNFQNGFAFKNSDYVAEGDGAFEIFRMGHILRGGGFNPDGKKVLVPQDQAQKLGRFLLKEGDILMCMTDMKSSMALLGHTARMPVSGRYLVNQRVGRITVKNPDLLDQLFLYYYSNSPGYIDWLRSHANSGVQVNLSTEAILNSPIPLPPLPVQQRIAGILSAYDELIESSQRRIQILEDMARALYREWFVLFRFPGHEKLPRVASPLGEIPKGWEVKKLGEIAEDMRRNVPKGELDEPQPYVGLEHIPRRSLALDAWKSTTELGSNKLEFKKGEVLFGKIRPYFHKVSVAPFDGLCSADTIVIRARSAEHYAFVVACVSSDAFVARASATANGAKMPRANWAVLEKYEVVIPTGKVAEQFSTLLADIIIQQQALIFQIKNLRQTRDLLLPRLLAGMST